MDVEYSFSSLFGICIPIGFVRFVISITLPRLVLKVISITLERIIDEVASHVYGLALNAIS